MEACGRSADFHLNAVCPGFGSRNSSFRQGVCVRKMAVQAHSLVPILSARNSPVVNCNCHIDTRIVAPRRSSAVTTRVVARERVTAASVDLQWWCGWAKISTIGAIPDGKHWQMGKLWTCRASCSPSTMVLFLPHDACIAATIGLISTTGTVGNGPSQYPAISLFILVLSLLQFLLSLLPIVMVLFTFFRGSDRIPD